MSPEPAWTYYVPCDRPLQSPTSLPPNGLPLPLTTAGMVCLLVSAGVKEGRGANVERKVVDRGS